MKETIRFGVVGTSWWADLMHLPSLKSHPDAEVVAICGRSKQPAEALAKKYGITKVYSDFNELIADGGLNAVVISTPDDSHYAMAMRAVEAGLHVLCEKPLANDVSQAVSMAEAAAKAGVTHMTLFTWRWSPVFSRLKTELEKGAIGQPIAARLSFLLGGAFEPGYRWRNDALRCNGTLGDLGAHLIDLTRWMLGDIVSVSATLDTLVDRKIPEEMPVNDHAVLSLTTRDSVRVSLIASNVALLGDQEGQIGVELFGTKGSLNGRLVFSGPDGGSRLLRAKRGAEPIEVIHSEAFRPNADPPDYMKVFVTSSAGPRAFVDAIRSQRGAQPDFHDGLAAQRVIEGAISASKSGSRVDL